MENIRQAVERAKARAEQLSGPGLVPRQQVRHSLGVAYEGKARTNEVELDLAYLQSQRIVTYDGKDPRSRPFDILRTEVLQSMDLQEWKILAVTSPTPSCGKTLVAVNLALSMGRQTERQVLLVDLDVRKPQVAASLGLKCREGLIGLIEGRIELNHAIVPVQAGNSNLEVLPTAPNSNGADVVDASGFHGVLRDIAEYARSRIVILDLPPLLMGHDVISILPQVDCVLLVGAMGRSKVADIEECEKHLQSTPLVRFVLNKTPYSEESYSYY
jgi:Mrp family chromosome partitioning ATPase